jgi:hypothetical protein
MMMLDRCLPGQYFIFRAFLDRLVPEWERQMMISTFSLFFRTSTIRLLT